MRFSAMVRNVLGTASEAEVLTEAVIGHLIIITKLLIIITELLIIIRCSPRL